MLLGVLLIVAGYIAARWVPKPARYLKVAGFVLLIGVPVAQVATGIYLAEQDMQAVAGE